MNETAVFGGRSWRLRRLFCGAQSAMGSTGRCRFGSGRFTPDSGAEGGALVEAVATKDALLAAWIGIPA
jgi:hypothetical protein